MWQSLLKVWALATVSDPRSRRERTRNLPSAGVASPEVVPDIRQDGSFGGRGAIMQLRQTNDFIDLSSMISRQMRYKEYERLRIMPEIETAMTVFADETCVTGDTKVMTPVGMIPIEVLAEKRKPDEMFLVYAFDQKKEDITLAWAYHPRKVKKSKIVQILFNDGSCLKCTPDHKILMRDNTWREAGDLKEGDELMACYRIQAKRETACKVGQHPKIFSYKWGWRSERLVLDEFRTGKKTYANERVDQITRCIANGLNTRAIGRYMHRTWSTLVEQLENQGLFYMDIKALHDKYPDRKIVASIDLSKEEVQVYDMTVKRHENFCTDSVIVHNCQIGDNKHLFDIVTDNRDIKEELEDLFFHPKMLNMDLQLYSLAKNLYIFGDYFLELIIDPTNPKKGIQKVLSLPVESMYRIESIKGKLIEFQQSKAGPDYEALARTDVMHATEEELEQSNAIRFIPHQITHFRIGDERRIFMPYGVSLIEPAKTAAHQLRLMEDAMMTNRLSRSPERKVFYIDVGNAPPFKTEMIMQRLKDQLRKTKTTSNVGGSGPGAVEERYKPVPMDEDIWLATRTGSNTRIEQLPGATGQNETEDVAMIRNKLFLALNFPKNYMAEEDPQITRMPVSAVNGKFARQIQRLQQCIATGLTEIAIRHLELRGFPVDLYDDLRVVLTPPSNHKEIADNEIKEAKYNRALAVVGAQLYSKFDALTKIIGHSEDEAKAIVARATAEQLQQLRLQAMAANPAWMGVVEKTPEGQEMGTSPAGPNPDQLGMQQQPSPEQNPEQSQGMEGEMSSDNSPQSGTEAQDTYGQPQKVETKPFPEPSLEDIERFDLDITDWSEDLDEEEIDIGDLDDEDI